MSEVPTDIVTRLADAFAPCPEVFTPHSIPYSRLAAVLVPLFVRKGEIRVLLTLRSSKLNSHAGEVALPGGKWDKTDPSLIDTALREASEECGLNAVDVTVVGVVPPRLARNSIAVYPVVAIVKPSVVPSANPGEVVQVFDVSLRDFLRSDKHYHTDIDYFGTPTFRVHHFDCATNILVSTPGLGRDRAAMKSTSFRDDAKPATASAEKVSIPTTELCKGSLPLSAEGPGGQVQHVFGLTAAILLEVAQVVYDCPVSYELAAPGCLYIATPPYASASLSSTPASAGSKL